MNKKDVHIELIHQGQHEQFRQTHEGQFYQVRPIGYLRYAESDKEMGQTMTTIRLLPDELRIIRTGSVESQFVFRPQERTSATYKIGTNQLSMIVFTNRLDYHWRGDRCQIACYYELWLDDQLLEQIQLQISFCSQELTILGQAFDN